MGSNSTFIFPPHWQRLPFNMLAQGLVTFSLFLASATTVNAKVNVLQSNDDGWAVSNIRALNTLLRNSGFNVGGVILE